MKFPKPGKATKKTKTKAERELLNLVVSLGCMICNNTSNVHHIRESGEPKNHFKTIPLCYRHHQGKDGIHTKGKKGKKGKKEWRKIYGHELDMLKKLLSDLKQ